MAAEERCCPLHSMWELHVLRVFVVGVVSVVTRRVTVTRDGFSKDSYSGASAFCVTDVLGSGHRKLLVQGVDSVACRVQVSTMAWLLGKEQPRTF